MKAPFRSARVVATVAALVATASAREVGAQVVRAPGPNTPRLMVATFKSTDRRLSVQAAQELRDEISAVINYRTLWVIPGPDVINTLKASGYPEDEALTPNDANALGKILRADEYLEGAVTKTATGFRLDARLVLTRDQSLVQPLEPVETDKLAKGIAALTKALGEARKQIDAEKKCLAAGRAGNWAEAIAASKAGSAAYPRATLSRICELNARTQLKQPADSIVAVAKEILKIDPRSKPALIAASLAYKEAGKTDEYITSLTELLASDPTNPRLQEQVVSELAASGKADIAKPIILQAVQENPGDVQLVKLLWLVLGASKDFKGAIATGEELVKMDTAAADLAFFKKLTALYAADSQAAKGAEAAARGVAKFPQDGELWLFRAQLERQSGQTQTALTSYQKAVELKQEGARLGLCLTYVDLQQAEQALGCLKESAAAGENADQVAQVALTLGNRAFRTAQQSKVLDDYRKAMPFLEFADATAKERQTQVQANFLIGANTMLFAQSALTEAAKTKSCALAKEAQESLAKAAVALPKGGAFNPATTQQLMSAVPALAPSAEAQVKAFCK